MHTEVTCACSPGGHEQIKRMAPLSGPMKRGDFDVVGIAETLEGAGVVAIAVNTDKTFFGCTHEDLTNIRVSFRLLPSVILTSIDRTNVW